MHLNETNLSILHLLEPANRIGALPAGEGLWHVPGFRVVTSEEMVRVAEQRR